MLSAFLCLSAAAGVIAAPHASRATSASSASAAVVTDVSVISNYWGQVRPYADNNATYFGNQYNGLPNGCGIEQVHQLHRHGSRYPTGGFDDGGNDNNFAAKLANYTAAGGNFSGPLEFLSGWSYQIASTGLLVPTGAAQEFASGAQFYNNYGRLLYNTPAGQPYYNASFVNGTARPKPVLRTTSQARILQSARFWAEGFFGYQTNVTDLYDLVVIPEGGTENNTLASYDSCFNDDTDEVGYKGDYLLYNYIPIYLADATERISAYFGGNFSLNTNDTYAMQSLCAYETNALGSSGFCGLFTEDEWAGFEYTLDIEYYYDYVYGNPTGRAQGIGYVQELIARLTNQYITVSNTSVNTSYDNNAAQFPLGQPFYLDMSHDDILLSVLNALSWDYLKGDLPVNSSAYPPNADRHFFLSHLTPFGARLTTEVIGCGSANPTAKENAETHYTQSSNGYVSTNATNKFIRMRLNNAVLPLTYIRGGLCTREDGLCALDDFLTSQANATALANYQFTCFANLTDVVNGFNGDGTAYAS